MVRGRGWPGAGLGGGGSVARDRIRAIHRGRGNLALQCPAEFIQGHTGKVRVSSRVAEQGSGTVAFKCL